VEEQSTWWGRNWFWAAPVGCLSPLLLCGGCIAALVVTIASAIRMSDPYREAVATAMASPAVKAELGEPLEIGIWTNGNIQINNGSGTAKFSIPIKGSKKSGTITVDATKDNGDWEYATLEFVPDGGGKAIDLKPKPAKD
jgi:hypothetical protein